LPLAYVCPLHLSQMSSFLVGHHALPKRWQKPVSWILALYARDCCVVAGCDAGYRGGTMAHEVPNVPPRRCTHFISQIVLPVHRETVPFIRKSLTVGGIDVSSHDHKHTRAVSAQR
jgi:hypothetical protein